MKIFVTILSIAIINITSGQSNKLVTLPIFTNYKNQIDTSLWFKWKFDLANKIKLDNLQLSSDTFHFRLWTDIQAIDIWTNDYILYHGLITNYAQKYNSNLYTKGKYKIAKVFSNQIKLDTSVAKKIFNLIDSLSVANIPSDDKIKGWRQGLDGEEFLIEISTKRKYDFRTYWTPSNFADTLFEAKQIQSLVDKLYRDFKVGKYYRSLKLPEGTYERDGIQGVKIRSTESIGTKNSITDWL